MAKVKLLLRSDVPHVGRAGDVVEVAPGHARNFLLPGALALPVTPGLARRLARDAGQRKRLVQARREAAERLAARLSEVTVTLQSAAGSDGKLFGSVTARDIQQALAAEGVALKADQILLESPLKKSGRFDVPVRLHTEVQGIAKVWIVEK